MKHRLIRLATTLIVVLPALMVTWNLATGLIGGLGLHDGDL